MAPTFIPIRYKALDNFNLSQFISLTAVPPAKPNICVCKAPVAAKLQTSWLFTTTDGAEAVFGVLSTVVVPETVEEVDVTVSAAYVSKAQAENNSTRHNTKQLNTKTFPLRLFFNS